MKPRRAAALALVGWYLVAPPIEQGQPMTDAPLVRWRVMDTFSSWTACLAGADTVRQHFERPPFSTEEEARRKIKLEMDAIKCISDSDLLKAK